MVLAVASSPQVSVKASRDMITYPKGPRHSSLGASGRVAQPIYCMHARYSGIAIVVYWRGNVLPRQACLCSRQFFRAHSLEQ